MNPSAPKCHAKPPPLLFNSRRIIAVRSLLLGIVCLCCMLPPAMGVAGQTRWVSDQLPLDMRSGNSNAYRVIKMLDPGTKVNVLKVDDKAQFSQVVTAEDINTIAHQAAKGTANFQNRPFV